MVPAARSAAIKACDEGSLAGSDAGAPDGGPDAEPEGADEGAGMGLAVWQETTITAAITAKVWTRFPMHPSRPASIGVLINRSGRGETLQRICEVPRDVR